MRLRPRHCPFRSNPLPSFAILIIVVFYLFTNLLHQKWTKTGPEERGVIHWDVISYYSYLPATFIYGDVSLDFLDHPPEGFVNDDKFWFYTIDNGNKLILTSMGLSFLYSPFFFVAHMLAPILGQPADGFSSIYQLLLVLSSLFYVVIGLIILQKILLKYFSSLSTAITLILVGLGTNLFFYTVHEGPMSHGYNFALITLFLHLVIRWYEHADYRKAIWIGLVYGLIVLIRPSNIFVGILFLGWGITNGQTLKERAALFLKQYRFLLVMAACFIIPWIPQMLYWKTVTGSFLFNSYGPSGSSFYFGSPHIFHLLFSFRKGWFLYTPVMFVATVGLLLMGRKCKSGQWPITLYLVLQIYLLASWWSWWNGGSFGLRSFVDIYGIMALPLAALVDTAMKARRKIALASGAFLFFLLYMNQFQTYQYTKGYIHHTGMTREAYLLNFLSFKPDGSCWQMLSLPDAQLARLGIYYDYYSGDDYSELRALGADEGLQLVREEIGQDPKITKEIHRHAKRTGLEYEEALEMVAERVYGEKTGQ